MNCCDLALWRLIVILIRIMSHPLIFLYDFFSAAAFLPSFHSTICFFFCFVRIIISYDGESDIEINRKDNSHQVSFAQKKKTVPASAATACLYGSGHVRVHTECRQIKTKMILPHDCITR